MAKKNCEMIKRIATEHNMRQFGYKISKWIKPSDTILLKGYSVNAILLQFNP